MELIRRISRYHDLYRRVRPGICMYLHAGKRKKRNDTLKNLKEKISVTCFVSVTCPSYRNFHFCYSCGELLLYTLQFLQFFSLNNRILTNSGPSSIPGEIQPTQLIGSLYAFRVFVLSLFRINFKIARGRANTEPLEVSFLLRLRLFTV